MKVSFLGGELVYDIFVWGSVIIIEGCSEDAVYLFFSFFFRYIVLSFFLILSSLTVRTYVFHMLGSHVTILCN